MLRVYLAVERTSGLPAVLCGLFARTPLRSLAARSIDARYATSKILANSSRRPKFNRIAFRAWLTSNQPEICLFEITFTACTRTRAHVRVHLRTRDSDCRSMEPCQRIERRKQREDLSSTILSLSFSFPFFFNSNDSTNQKRERDNNEQLYEKVVRLVGEKKKRGRKMGRGRETVLSPCRHLGASRCRVGEGETSKEEEE